ncbi:hypothetical protein I7I50_07947 [Histoplasma capsulatum G186AR]|uniref:Uncharacterized protein n=1 Tax=Ajellomyces capsulatus TaxID=5037 RepID=A0A8H7YHF5_AJECA|nr:hypothetical protein I7I52_08463 [Histoplasma capsulatum]QSS68509.1 hypothetical protein I7I50_07947 [Histoplasma capsulatum G186AR]
MPLSAALLQRGSRPFSSKTLKDCRPSAVFTVNQSTCEPVLVRGRARLMPSSAILRELCGRISDAIMKIVDKRIISSSTVLVMCPGR